VAFQCGHCNATFGKNKNLRQHVKVKHAGKDLPPRLRVGRKAKRSVPTRSVEDEHAATAEFGTRNLHLAVFVAGCFFETHCSSSSSRNEYYLGGIITLLLQDHRTMS